MQDIPTGPTPQLVLTRTEDVLGETRVDACVSALAPDASAVFAWKQHASFPVGQQVQCPIDDTELGQPFLLRYQEECSAWFQENASKQADFYCVESAQSVAHVRAMVLAITKVTGKPVMAKLSVSEDGTYLTDGVETLAAIAVLQSIGVSSVALVAPTMEALQEALHASAPFARVDLGACMPAHWQTAEATLANVAFVVQHQMQDANTLQADLRSFGGFVQVAREHDDMLLSADGRHAQFILPTIDISDEIVCDARFEETLLEAEDNAGAIKILLQTEDDLVVLERNHYMITKPVCLCAERAGLLEKGLRVFQGRSLYDGTWVQQEAVLNYFAKRYGMIRL